MNFAAYRVERGCWSFSWGVEWPSTSPCGIARGAGKPNRRDCGAFFRRDLA